MRLGICTLILALSAGVANSSERYIHQRVDAVEDRPYLQEIGRQIPTETPVTAIGAARDLSGEVLVFAGTKEGLYRVQGHELHPVEAGPPGPIKKIHIWFGADAGGQAAFRAVCLTSNAAWLLKDNTWRELAEGDFVDADSRFVASERNLYVAKSEGLTRLGLEQSPLPIKAIARQGNTIYCLAPDRLFLYDGREYVHGDDVIEFGALPSKDCRDLLSLGNRLIVATHYGLGEVRGTAATQILGSDGLPWEECHHLAIGLGGYWIGTTKGAIRATDEGDFHYFTAPRWLPHNRVNGLAYARNTMYIATDGGLGIIEYEPWTLAKKAAYYEQHLDVWNQKRMAFTHKLEWNEGKGGWVREVSDNDIGWSTHYWAAMGFKYAATGDEAAKQAAIEGFNCMKWSEEITSIDGFPARSIWAVGETGNKATGGSGGYPAEWHPTDDGLWEWKGDTSSDETDAQFYYARVLHDLVADDTMKEDVREHVARIAGHIIDNGWVLRDVDGKPTVWGRWDLDYFNSPRGSYAKGLNGLEVLTYMHVARKLTDAPHFEEAFDWLIDHDYHWWVIDQKLVGVPQFVNHSDDRLAFYCYYALLDGYFDPPLQSIFERSLARSWAIERIEHNPWFNFIYGALSLNECEAEAAVEHLRAWPLDLVRHAWDFEHRRDLDPPEGYIPYAHGMKPISPRERGGYRWSENPFELEGGNGRTVIDPAGWLDAYWMGRYYGFISPPQTDDPELLEPPEPPEDPPGAAPYDGPPMPWVLSTK